MSVEFSVTVHQPVGVADLREDTQKVLRDLLHLSVLPALRSSESEHGHAMLREAGDVVVFEGDGPGEATVMLLDLPTDESCTAFDRTALVSAGGLRSEVSVAIAIAAAIALARATGARVTDDALLVSSTPSVEPTRLLDSIRLRKPHVDIRLAAHELLEIAGLT